MKKLIVFWAGYFWGHVQVSRHKLWVFYYIIKINFKIKHPDKWALFKRGLVHDLDKFFWAEAKYFAKVAFKLKTITYGTDEYREMLKCIKPCITLHYSKNSHHPEYYKDGYQGLSHLDKLEMTADWIAATKRHTDGNIFASLEKNQDRFSYNDKEKEFLKSIVDKII
ncbi:MAG: DUF5662 family protein [Candidatus Asgardarchaeia archaeon]